MVWAEQRIQDVPLNFRDPLAAHIYRKFCQLGALRRVGYSAPQIDAFDAECFAIIEAELARLRAPKGKDGGKNTS